MIKIDYNKKQREIINTIDVNNKPKLLMHACCAPCSTACIERVLDFFSLTILYYNPNITDEEEYEKRFYELEKYLDTRYKGEVKLVKGRYNKEDYLENIKGHEEDKEGGERCKICFRMRLKEGAIYGKENGFDYFTTTLSVSPYKNAENLNKIGEEIGEEVGIKYLYADFKKEDGYKRSITLSKEYGLYRQDYCGCEFSKRRDLD